MKGRLRWALYLLVALFFGFVMLDALGVFDSSPYFEVPHGNHVHYVPKSCEDPEIGRFPTRPPGPGETITCAGQIVPAEP